MTVALQDAEVLMAVRGSLKERCALSAVIKLLTVLAHRESPALQSEAVQDAFSLAIGNIAEETEKLFDKFMFIAFAEQTGFSLPADNDNGRPH